MTVLTEWRRREGRKGREDMYQDSEGAAASRLSKLVSFIFFHIYICVNLRNENSLPGGPAGLSFIMQGWRMEDERWEIGREV